MSPRTIVITGAGRGLGLGLTRALAQNPANIIIGTVRDRSAADGLTTLGARAILMDVASDDSISAAAGELADVGAIDVLINNAGINAKAVGAATDGRGPLAVGRAEFLSVMDVNAAAPMMVTRALLAQLRAAPAPIVVNISSQLGAISFGGGFGDDIAYNASKAALNMVTVRTASELKADGVCLVAVHPGWVQTDMGGAAASLGIDESASAICETISALTLADSGRFLRWDGTDHAW